MPIVNKAQLADLLGYAERTLTQWQDEGMPVERHADLRGQANEYNTAEVVAWLVARADRKARAENPREELYRRQVQLAQLKIEETMNRLVDAKEVEAGYTRMVVSARQRLMRLPVELPTQLETLPAALWSDCISKALIEALTELSKGQTNDPSGEDPQK